MEETTRSVVSHWLTLFSFPDLHTHYQLLDESKNQCRFVAFKYCRVCLQVLDVLRSLCVCNGVAVRSNQNLITENLLPGRDLLLQTNIVNYVTRYLYIFEIIQNTEWTCHFNMVMTGPFTFTLSVRPNIFLGTCEGSTQYKKWYYEVMVDHVESFVTAQATHLRVGWAMTEGYSPYPGGGEAWGGNGVGDDLYSYSFDGLHLWSGKMNNN